MRNLSWTVATTGINFNMAEYLICYKQSYSFTLFRSALWFSHMVDCYHTCIRCFLACGTTLLTVYNMISKAFIADQVICRHWSHGHCQFFKDQRLCKEPSHIEWLLNSGAITAGIRSAAEYIAYANHAVSPHSGLCYCYTPDSRLVTSALTSPWQSWHLLVSRVAPPNRGQPSNGYIYNERWLQTYLDIPSTINSLEI